MEFPTDIRYAKEHGWVRAAGAEVVCGISDHAQKELGDVVFVDLPKPGTAVSRGRPYGVVESVKAVSDLIAPLSGTVLRVNEQLAGEPELLNRDPYGNGWTIAVAPGDPAAPAGLMSAEDYRAHIAGIAGDG